MLISDEGGIVYLNAVSRLSREELTNFNWFVVLGQALAGFL